MTIEEAIEGLELLKILDAPDLNKSIKMAIAALRAQQTPAKLDRRRWKGCDYCDANIYVKVKKHLRPLLAPATYVGELRDKLEDLTSEAYVEVHKKYCPLCGRPLTEEAWAELERRINDGTTDI